MAFFEEDYSREKDCRYTRYLKTESVETLRTILMNEDLLIPGYASKFPDTVAFMYEDFLKVEAERGEE